MKKTISFAILHFGVAFTVAYLLTGELLTASLIALIAVSYTHLTLPTIVRWCRSRWSPYH